MSSHQRVLVTGADGFIGSHLTEALVREGLSVKAFVNYNSFNSWGWLDRCANEIRGHFEIVQGDIRDHYGTREAVKGCDTIIHLAALIAIPHSYRSPQSYVETNILGTLNLLQAARDLNVSKFIHTSTSEVYGTPESVPITESHPLRGQSPYAASKIGADQLAFSFWASFNLPVLIIRPFNTYGPRQSARAVIPTIISQIANGSKTLKLGASTPRRDFLYVLDTVAGFVSALKSEGNFGEVINLGTNYDISISEISTLILKLMNSSMQIEIDTDRVRPENSEVKVLRADNSKALASLNWKPAYSGLDGLRIGLVETIDWFTNSDNLSFYKPNIYNT
jgi:dTDP-glucose 4,6-dehydratase